MKQIIWIPLAALLLAAPVPALGQTRDAPPRSPRGMTERGAERKPLDLLLRHREEIGLTDAQITQLRNIAERLEEQNRPLIEQLRAAGVPMQRRGMKPRGDASGTQRRMTPEQRREIREKDGRASPRVATAPVKIPARRCRRRGRC